MTPPTGTRDGQVLVVVDLQRLVLEATEWRVPAARAIVPCVRELAGAFGPATVFTRHVPPADGGTGTWRSFYERWHGLLSDDHLLDVPAELVPAGATILDKSVYSAFGPELRQLLRDRRANAIVVCGVETDCCVQATVLDAVDAGVAVTVAEDAIASPSEEAHAGVIAAWRRLPEQVWLTSTAHLLSSA